MKEVWWVGDGRNYGTDVCKGGEADEPSMDEL